MSRWLRRLSLLGAVALSSILSAPQVLAHPGGEPFIHVPQTDVVPGSSFPVIVADMGKGETVTFELLADPTVVRLGEAPGTADGHLETTLTLPAATPDGYVQLRARIPDGTEATTWIHVLAGAAPATIAGGDSFEYMPYMAGLLALGALAVLLIRTRRRPATKSTMR